MSNLVWLSVLCALLFVVDITRSATLYSSVPATTATAPAPGNPETDQTKVKPASLDVSETGLHISLCTSCQYVGQYNKIKEVINQELPGIEVSYSEYPVTFMKSLLGYVIMAVQYAIIAVAIGGERVLAYLNIPMNDFIKGMMEKKFMYGMGAWYLGNMLKSMLTSTDAFEVFFDGQQIFSRLASEPRRFPESEQLVAVIRSMLGDI